MLKDEQGRSVQGIKNLDISFYKNLLGHSSHEFSSIKADRVARLIKKKFSAGCIASMEAPISKSEIQNVVFSLKPSKAPGLDGFSAGFFLKAWAIVGNDFCDAVLEFFDSGKLLKEANSTILTLVPKKRNATSMSEFRPIACCSVVYKMHYKNSGQPDD
jgi:hypothetical protein